MNVQKFFKKVFSNKLICLGVIPFVLILFWLVFSIIYNNKISFSVNLQKHSQDDIKSVPQERLLKGKKITGEFTARDNYLGLVLFRFNEYVKHDFNSEDVLVFRIKEKNSLSWYYLNNYRSGLLENNLLFPFGFPVINEAKGKTYVFEIESLFGNKVNSARVDKDKLDIYTGYKYPKDIILESKKSTIKFLINKSITSFTNLDFLLSSIIYLVPLILYFFVYFIVTHIRLSGKLENNIFYLLVFIIFIDIFLIKETYLGIIVSVVLVLGCFVFKSKLKSKIYLILALILILLWVLFTILKIDSFQSKINIWTYALLVLGTLKIILEERLFKKK